MKRWFIKLHRWLALLFALPLLIVIGTGLVLSFEPWLVVQSIEPNTVTADKVQALIDQYDPQGKARGISFKSYDRTLTIGGGRGGGTVVDITTGQVSPGPSGMANFLVTARRLHETLLIDASWLVIASSFVMLALALFGVLMGWPRLRSLRNNLSGWHKAAGWGLLPLVVLSPLSGILLAWNITLTSTPAPSPAAQATAQSAPAEGQGQGREQGQGEGRGQGQGQQGQGQRAPLSLAEAVKVVGQQHDLSTLVWIRPQGGRMLARLVEDGEFRVYAVTREGATPMPRNLPRLWHEGNFAGAWSSLMNIVTSLAMVILLVTGPWLWLQRRNARRRAQQGRAVAQAA